MKIIRINLALNSGASWVVISEPNTIIIASAEYFLVAIADRIEMPKAYQKC